ncbi:MAG: HD domain-containing protein [Armatimonadota bacterium]|nr:HD domain-containing protein [Armatimonadota bacterium]
MAAATGVRGHIFDRSDAFIVRWHARLTNRRETLAEHHYFVARNVLMICRALAHYGIAEPNTLDAVTLALVHDAVERITGDVSGRLKRLAPELRAVLVEVERRVIDGMLFPSLPDGIGSYYRALARRASDAGSDDLEAQIVKYADKLEAYLFAKTELDLGNNLMNDVVALIEGELAELRWGWLAALRERTGLP